MEEGLARDFESDLDRIIFLDFDGVVEGDKAHSFEKPQMEQLQRVVQETKAKIVVVSTWAGAYPEYVEEFESYEGLAVSGLITWAQKNFYLTKNGRMEKPPWKEDLLYSKNGLYHRGKAILNFVEGVNRYYSKKIDWLVADDEIQDYMKINERGEVELIPNFHSRLIIPSWHLSLDQKFEPSADIGDWPGLLPIDADAAISLFETGVATEHQKSLMNELKEKCVYRNQIPMEFIESSQAPS